tara:strand:+ start:993 stop:1169 length:177 start_codon:yes stop_codon:yes gene_type:complete
MRQKITLKKFNILVERKVKELFESGDWHKSDLPDLQEAVIEILEAEYEISVDNVSGHT